MTDTKDTYVCVNCGNTVDNLYKRYGESVLKLCNCQHCGEVADKYLEYDKVIILIDLILFNKEAYRHVLYNVNYKGHFKLALLQLIVISFDECVYRQNIINSEESGSFHESDIYTLILIAILGKSILVLIILFYLIIYTIFSLKQPVSKAYIAKIWEAITISSFGYFFLLTVLIWDDSQREIHLVFITTYVTLSQIQALTVVTAVPRPLLGAICIFSVVVHHIFSAFLKVRFQTEVSKSSLQFL